MGESKHRERRKQLLRIAHERGYSEAPRYMLMHGRWWDTRSGNLVQPRNGLNLHWLHDSIQKSQLANPRAG